VTSINATLGNNRVGTRLLFVVVLAGWRRA
jgi:hypothetical protein